MQFMRKKKLEVIICAIAIVYIKISGSFDLKVTYKSQIIPSYRILIVFIYIYPKAVSISQPFYQCDFY